MKVKYKGSESSGKNSQGGEGGWVGKQGVSKPRQKGARSPGTLQTMLRSLDFCPYSDRKLFKNVEQESGINHLYF